MHPDIILWFCNIPLSTSFLHSQTSFLPFGSPRFNLICVPNACADLYLTCFSIHVSFERLYLILNNNNNNVLMIFENLKFTFLVLWFLYLKSCYSVVLKNKCLCTSLQVFSIEPRVKVIKVALWSYLVFHGFTWVFNLWRKDFVDGHELRLKDHEVMYAFNYDKSCVGFLLLSWCCWLWNLCMWWVRLLKEFVLELDVIMPETFLNACICIWPYIVFPRNS